MLGRLAGGIGKTVWCPMAEHKFTDMNVDECMTLTGDATVKQVAEHLSLHPVTVRILARSGEFPNAYKTGRGARSSPLRIPWSDVARWRERNPRVSQ